MGNSSNAARLDDTVDSREHDAVVGNETQVEVTMTSESNFYAGFDEVVAEGGLFVATYDTRRVGESVMISLTLPAIPEPQKIVGEVQWLRDHNPVSDSSAGMGLRLVSVSPETRRLIDRFVRNRAPMFYEKS